MEKLIRRLVVMILSLTSLAACTHAGGHYSDSYQNFLSDTQGAMWEEYQGRPGVRVVDEKAFETMRRYLIDRYKGVHVAHSFVGVNGERVDCIPIAEQFSLKKQGGISVEWKAPAAPAVSGAAGKEPSGGEFKERKSLDLTLKPGSRDQEGNERFCSDKTIPVRRVTLDELVRFPTLEDFFRKGERREDGRDIPADSTHYYARGVQFVDNFGADSWLNVWSPTVSTNRMSLSQLWVVGDTGDNKQTVEAGWQVYPDKWSSDKAALFIYYTTGGYKDGTGCYNLDCSGFVQLANNVYLGAGFDHYSVTDGTQWGFELQYKRANDGNWWLFYKGPGEWIPVGYYPKSLFGRGRLASKAEKIAFGGECTGKAAAKQMGSGAKSDQGFGKAAYQNTIFYIDTNTTSQWANLTKEEPDPTCYTATIHNIFGTWGTYLYFGGPSCP